MTAQCPRLKWLIFQRICKLIKDRVIDDIGTILAYNGGMKSKQEALQAMPLFVFFYCKM